MARKRNPDLSAVRTALSKGSTKGLLIALGVAGAGVGLWYLWRVWQHKKEDERIDRLGLRAKPVQVPVLNVPSNNTADTKASDVFDVWAIKR